MNFFMCFDSKGQEKFKLKKSVKLRHKIICDL